MATKMNTGLLGQQYSTFDQFVGKRPALSPFTSMPECLKSNEVNIRNHKSTIQRAALGPVDPTQPNQPFWADKGKKWGVTPGDARGRLCANCEHFIQTSDVMQWIERGPAKTFKTSMVNPAIKDIESKPVAVCKLYNITCSPTRTCDSQELGGPIDDLKFQALQSQGQEID